MISFNMSAQSSEPDTPSWSITPRYLSAIMLSLFWSQQPNWSYCVQNSRCHWGLKGGSKSRHWGWADADPTRLNNITDTTREKAGRHWGFLGDVGADTVRKTARPTPFGWSAASSILVAVATCPNVCSPLNRNQYVKEECANVRVRKCMQMNVRPSFFPSVISPPPQSYNTSLPVLSPI